MKYLENLKKLGLSEDQAKIYEILISHSLLPARLVAERAGVGRELAYLLLRQLEALHLAERITSGKVTLFRAKHPRHIKKLLEDQRNLLVAAEAGYQESITHMVSDFNMSQGKPFVRFYEGEEGLQKTYDHILKYAKEVRVIRSLYDYEHQNLRAMVTEQLKNQAAKNIRSFVLSPHLPHMRPEKLSHNLERKLTRKIIPKEKFIMPAQVMIYNNTVSITSMKKNIITTVIENEDIAATFKNLFQYMWDSE